MNNERLTRKIYNLTEASKILGICPRTLNRWIERGEVKRIIHAGRPYITRVELEKQLGETYE